MNKFDQPLAGSSEHSDIVGKDILNPLAKKNTFEVEGANDDPLCFSYRGWAERGFAALYL